LFVQHVKTCLMGEAPPLLPLLLPLLPELLPLPPGL